MRLLAVSAVPTPLLALDVQRAGKPGAPGGSMESPFAIVLLLFHGPGGTFLNRHFGILLESGKALDPGAFGYASCRRWPSAQEIVRPHGHRDARRRPERDQTNKLPDPRRVEDAAALPHFLETTPHTPPPA